jgi:hypothetical protein
VKVDGAESRRLVNGWLQELIEKRHNDEVHTCLHEAADHAGLRSVSHDPGRNICARRHREWVPREVPGRGQAQQATHGVVERAMPFQHRRLL